MKTKGLKVCLKKNGQLVRGTKAELVMQFQCETLICNSPPPFLCSWNITALLLRGSYCRVLQQIKTVFALHDLTACRPSVAAANVPVNKLPPYAGAENCKMLSDGSGQLDGCNWFICYKSMI